MSFSAGQAGQAGRSLAIAGIQPAPHGFFHAGQAGQPSMCDAICPAVPRTIFRLRGSMKPLPFMALPRLPRLPRDFLQ